MPKSTKSLDPLLQLLAASGLPIYAVDGDRRIVYCNPALAAWVELSADRVIGRLVEYHSEPDAEGDSKRDAAGPLTGLCPPPRALAGEACFGTVSCLPRDGRLVHRHAEFVPLHVDESHRESQQNGPVLALLAGVNLSPSELTAELSTEPTADELHRTIRRFRRAQADRYKIESLLGTSSAIRKVRSQVAAAAASGANCWICGRPGTGRSSVARAIHYYGASDGSAKLVTIDGETLSDDGLRRALDAVGNASADSSRRSTLLMEHLECMAPAHQGQIVEAIRRGALTARVLATTCEPADCNAVEDEATREIDAVLRDAVSTITIHVPRLADRPEDLPILAQCFLEAANRGHALQAGSLRADALDLLALYRWPGELDELRDVIAAAHSAAATHAIGPADLPTVIHHAAKTAALPERTVERIALDDVLTTIEKEAIARALAQAGGNKSEAADLLGLTRPRLYRRMEQLGLAAPAASEPMPKFKESPLPDFREVEPEEPTA